MNLTEFNKGLSHTNIEGNVSGNGSTAVMTIHPTIDKAINILIIINLFVTMISLGCTMEILKIKNHLLRPKGVAIALLAQFGIMPLAAFSLAKLMQMNPMDSLTVLLCGCCPGGTLSNLFSLAIKGDMNLR